MYLKLKLFAVTVLVALSASSHLQNEENDEHDDKELDKSVTKLNFVIFLTEPDVSSAKKIHEDKNVFCLKKDIMPCTDKYLKGMPRELVKYARLKNVSCNCEEILRNSLKSLLQWAEVSKQMATGSVSLQDKIQSEEIVSKPGNQKILRDFFPRRRRHTRQKRSVYLMSNSEAHNREDLIYLPLPVDEKGKTDEPILKIINSHDVPIYNAYPRKKAIKFNNINRYDNLESNKPTGMEILGRNGHRRSNQVKLYPKHTKKAFFKVVHTEPPKDQKPVTPCPNKTMKETTTASAETEQTDTIMSESTDEDMADELEELSTTCSSLESNDSEEVTEEAASKENNGENKNGPSGNIFDMLQIMNSIKASYFQEFFQPLWGNENATQPSLETITKSMLEQLKNVSAMHGFIAVVTGGKLSDLNSTSSDLSKTIKSIKNTCNENRTVVIVTGFCPKKKRKKSNCATRPVKIPMFISGVYSDRFHEVNELYDIPHIIRDVIKEECQKLEESEGEDEKNNFVRFLPNEGEMQLAETLIDQTYSGFDEEVAPTIYKRSIFTRELENNGETFVLPRLLLSLFCFVIFRIIF